MAKKSALNANSPLVKIAALAAGYFLLADPINNAIDKVLVKALPAKDASGAASTTTISDMGQYAAIGAEGIGAYMLLLKGRKTIVKTATGGILGGAALKRALKKFGVVSGYQRVPVIGSYQRVPVIGNAQSGYRVNGMNGNGGYRVNGRNTSAVMGNVNVNDDLVNSMPDGSGILAK